MNNQAIIEYNRVQSDEIATICKVLMDKISTTLPEAASKLYHANPVWFINDNPIVGYDVAKDKSHVNLLFWSGQSFDEPQLKAAGSFKAAGTRYTSVENIDTNLLKTWLEKSKAIQWDYKNIRQNEGELHKLAG